MKYRQIGKNDPTVSAIGYGAMVLSPGIYNPVEEEESLSTIERVFDLGINFVGTADIYGQGHNERLIAGAIRSRRSKVILATKFGGDSGATAPKPLPRDQAASRAIATAAQKRAKWREPDNGKEKRKLPSMRSPLV
jgi:aryl-alcohol dehydrogenase-like predicted oxidoreductase